MDDNLIIAIAAVVSATLAFASLVNTVIIQRKTAAENKKNNTINAYNRLQDKVLDYMAKYPKEQVEILVDDRDYEPEIKEAYDACRTLIARCEHFAVGVNTGVYDIDLVDDLGGKHLIYLYQKVLPIIDEARAHDEEAYKEFEKMVTALAKLRDLK